MPSTNHYDPIAIKPHICLFVLVFDRVYGKFDSTQLKALNEFLPTEEEEAGLKQYVSNASKNETTRQEAMNALCPCEKYMVALMEVPSASANFNCMIFQIQFSSRIDEIKESIDTLMNACIDVMSSSRLRKLMAVILTIGNQINTGGDGNMAEGFTLDALLKLNEVCFISCVAERFYLTAVGLSKLSDTIGRL